MVGLDSMAFERFAPRTGEANMEIRNQSKTGPVVPSLADITATMSDQIDDMKRRLLDRLSRDPASFAQIEVEIHDRFRHLADQMTASLLAEATIAADRTEPSQKGGPAAATDRNVPRRRGG
jgi:hypothetical protein